MTKKWKDEMKDICVRNHSENLYEEEIIECKAVQNLPQSKNEWNLICSDVLQYVRVHATSIDAAFLLFHSYSCSIIPKLESPGVFIFETFPDGLPMIYMEQCCFGPRIRIQLYGKSISNVTSIYRYIHPDFRRKSAEEMNEIDALEVTTNEGFVTLYKNL